MINFAEIFEKQDAFVETMKSAKLQREDFIKHFPSDKIGTMSKEEYVIGKHSTNTFCYYLEHKLNEYGELKGQSSSNKFGVYVSNGEYKHTEKFGTSLNDAFNNVKKEVTKLIAAGRIEDLNDIKANILAPTVKAKILSVYFPDKYLSVLSGKHTDIFIRKLGINAVEKDMSDEEKKKLLIGYKNADKLMKKWDNINFVHFLYQFYNPKETMDVVNLYEIAAEAGYNNEGISEYIYKDKLVKIRKPSANINRVKKECDGYCQICGERFGDNYEEYVVEVHHIEYFSVSQNNKLSNLIAVCPNHHRLIHKLNPRFDRETLTFIYPNEYKECIKRPNHLKRGNTEGKQL